MAKLVDAQVSEACGRNPVLVRVQSSALKKNLMEILDIVDHNDCIIAQMPRGSLEIDVGVYFRTVNVFIENEHGQLWIPRRTAHKEMFPLALDFSAGGCVSSGESYEQAFAREVQEELNLDVTTVSYTHKGYFKPQVTGSSCFMHVYVIHSNQVPNYNPDDFLHYYWLTPQELRAKIDSGDKFKSDLPRVLRQLY